MNLYYDYTTDDSNVIIDKTAPTATSTDSSEIEYIYSGITKQIDLSCSATDEYQLYQMQLYMSGADETTIHASTINSISGPSESTIFRKILGRGVYKCNCKAIDSAGNNAFATERTLTISFLPPAPVAPGITTNNQVMDDSSLNREITHRSGLKDTSSAGNLFQTVAAGGEKMFENIATNGIILAPILIIILGIYFALTKLNILKQ